MGNRDGLIYDPQTINWEARKRVAELEMDPTQADALESRRADQHKTIKLPVILGIAFVLLSSGFLGLSLMQVFR
jgi:hypothetical protein